MILGPCDGCQGTHEATYSHEGAWSQGAIYEVPCPIDGRSTFVTTEVITHTPERRVPGLEVSDR